MTQTLVNHRTRSVPRRGAGTARRVLSWIKCDVLLVPTGILTMADAITGETAETSRRWGRPADKPARGSAVFGMGLASAVMGLMSWFLLMLLLISVVRGPFYGLVEHGPYGPGTWGGPTRAGAWAVHAAVSIPIIVLIPFVLRGVAALHAALVRTVYGASTAKWVLPATIVFCAGGMLFFWSWIQQL
ncbi:hypothetical protein OG474_01045 [Kribbella sp. NBC_01505]|uniref:hypothetical protein n=1 Tax=Kribbella sp. NBC_01505 TaxID=2903580 RepID=UPI00386E9D85